MFGIVRAIVWERSSGRCERCGHGLPAIWECHHRRLRSQGGNDSPANLLALHMRCHNAGETGSVHHSPGAAYARGYLVSAYADPHEVPVLLHGRRWVLLDGLGGYVPTNAPDDFNEEEKP